MGILRSGHRLRRQVDCGACGLLSASGGPVCVSASPRGSALVWGSERSKHSPVGPREENRAHTLRCHLVQSIPSESHVNSSGEAFYAHFTDDIRMVSASSKVKWLTSDTPTIHIFMATQSPRLSFKPHTDQTCTRQQVFLRCLQPCVGVTRSKGETLP